MKAYHETLREAQKFLEKNQTLNEDLHENDNPSQKEVELKSTVESGNQTLGSDFNSGPKVGVCSLTGSLIIFLPFC